MKSGIQYFDQLTIELISYYCYNGWNRVTIKKGSPEMITSDSEQSNNMFIQEQGKYVRTV